MCRINRIDKGQKMPAPPAVIGHSGKQGPGSQATCARKLGIKRPAAWLVPGDIGTHLQHVCAQLGGIARIAQQLVAFGDVIAAHAWR